MTFPSPRPGLVIRYGFLWSHERDGGATEGAKDRPCVIVATSRRADSNEMQVIVTPITHEPPSDPAAALEIKPAIRRALGLDSTRQWLRFDELNRFDWPGFDLRPIPGRGDSWAYGMLPGAIYDELRRAILERQRARKVRASSR